MPCHRTGYDVHIPAIQMPKKKRKTERKQENIMKNNEQNRTDKKEPERKCRAPHPARYMTTQIKSKKRHNNCEQSKTKDERKGPANRSATFNKAPSRKRHQLVVRVAQTGSVLL